MGLITTAPNQPVKPTYSAPTYSAPRRSAFEDRMGLPQYSPLPVARPAPQPVAQPAPQPVAPPAATGGLVTTVPSPATGGSTYQPRQTSTKAESGATQAAPLATQAVQPATRVAPSAAAPAASTSNGAAQYTATTAEVDPTKTSAGLLASMLAADSPYVTRAKTLAQEGMNDRGLMSSSLAQGAGVNAAIDAAGQFALTDAGIYSATQGRNQDAINASRQFNTGQTNAFGLADKNISAQTARDAALQGYTQANMALGQEYTQANMATQQSFDLSKMAAANGYTIDQMKAMTKEDLIKMAATNGYDLGKMAKQNGYDLATMDKQQVFDLAKMDKTYAQSDKEIATKFGNDKELIGIQKDASIEISRIGSQYSQLTQLSTSATTLTTSTNASINAILLNPDLTGDSAQPDPDNPGKFLSNKQVAVNQVMSNYGNSLQLIASISGDVDLSDFINTVTGG